MSDPTNQFSHDIEQLFCQAIELESTQDRERFLNKLSEELPDLAKQLERLLSAHYGSGHAFDSPEHLKPIMAATLDHQPDQACGSSIGPYRLLEEIGRGGMGVVYMAEQTAPVRRKVALKIVIPGLDIRQVLARFEAERQALALMDHPNIARVLDAGTTANGQPYFVMELVKGVPISKYCDTHRLDVRQRLELFLPVCHAIQHAHQKGIIHRDIKPSNVLVARYDGQAVPKVIDFGVAKAVGQQLTERTMFTNFGSIVGTLEYMSPEQAEFNALDIDTRSDVYSLGVLLYELLTGAPPISIDQLKNAGLMEMLRVIREQETPAPSTRVGTSETLASVCANRRAEPISLIRSLRGELDWIVLRALEKDRDRRYDSALSLAQDIQRHLSDDKVEACPPSTLYLLKKLFRRHQRIVTTAGLVAVMLMATAAFSFWQASIAITAGRRAQAAAQQAETARADEEREKQRALSAERNAEVSAMQAAANERTAQAKAHELQQQIYAADMIRIQNAWSRGDMFTVREFLKRHAPQPGQPDLRNIEWYYFNNRLNQDLFTIADLPATIVGLHFTSDASQLIAASGTSVRLLNAHTGEEVRTLVELPHRVINTQLSPSGRDLAIATSDGTASVCHLEDGNITHSFAGSDEQTEQNACPLAFNATGQILAVGGMDGSLRFWNIESGEQSRAPINLKEPIASVYWSKRSDVIVLGTNKGRVQVWKSDANEPLQNLQNDEWRIASVAMHPTEDQLAADVGGTIKIWDVSSGKELKSLERVRSAIGFHFSPDGASLIIPSTSGAIEVRELALGVQQKIFEGHCSTIRALAISPDGKRLASASGDSGSYFRNDASLRVWDFQSPSGPSTCFGATFALDFSADSKWLGAFGFDGCPHIFDSFTGTLVRKLEPIPELAQQVYALAFDPTHQYLASGGQSVSLSRVTDGKSIKRFQPDKGWLRSLSFSPDGKRLCVGAWRGLKVFDIDTGKSIEGLELDSGVFSTAFSADMRWLAATTTSALVVWDLAERKIVKRMELPVESKATVDFHPNSQQLTVGCSDGLILTWSLEDWRMTSTLRGHRGAVTDIEYSFDGSRLLSGSVDGLAIVWETASDSEILTLDSNAWIVGVGFSPDGQHIATASYDGFLRIWNAPRNQLK